jgi:hypothetical protein
MTVAWKPAGCIRDSRGLRRPQVRALRPVGYRGRMFRANVQVLRAVGVSAAAIMLGPGCGSSGKSPAHGHGSGASTSTDDACSAASLGLTGARVVDGWRLPQGCTFAPALAGTAPAWITTDAELRANLRCAGDPPPLDVDFAREAIWLRHGSLSPAGTGTRAFDDGTTLSVVALMRPSCPGDPMPMPLPWVDALRVPLPATRAVREQSCTVSRRCS